jgi:hypothetical protein
MITCSKIIFRKVYQINSTFKVKTDFCPSVRAYELHFYTSILTYWFWKTSCKISVHTCHWYIHTYLCIFLKVSFKNLNYMHLWSRTTLWTIFQGPYVTPSPLTKIFHVNSNNNCAIPVYLLQCYKNSIVLCLSYRWGLRTPSNNMQRVRCGLTQQSCYGSKCKTGHRTNLLTCTASVFCSKYQLIL